MPVIHVGTQVRAPLERVFDLSLSIDLHVTTAGSSRETAIAGVTTGLIGLGEEVTWRARHLGVWQTLTTRITAWDRPRHFRDSMVRGAFRRFDHDHFFDPQEDGSTLMRDRFDFEAPWGYLGSIAEWMFLERYMRRFIIERNRILKQVAESEAWRQYLGQ